MPLPHVSRASFDRRTVASAQAHASWSATPPLSGFAFLQKGVSGCGCGLGEECMRAIPAAKRLMFVGIVAALPTHPIPSAFAGNHGYHVLYNFCSQEQCTDGAQPTGVIADPSGNLLGVTYPGGDNNSGTVFELAHIAKGIYAESVLYSFCSAANCVDGALPMGSLIRDKAGNLYGITDEG